MPLPSERLITDGVLEARRAHSAGCSESSRAYVRVHESRWREAYICDEYTCIQMSIYVIACGCVWMCIYINTYSWLGALIHCTSMCMRPYVATHTDAHKPRHACTSWLKHEGKNTADTPSHSQPRYGLKPGDDDWTLQMTLPAHGPTICTHPGVFLPAQQWPGAALDPLSVSLLLCSGSSGGKLERSEWRSGRGASAERRGHVSRLSLTQPTLNVIWSRC